MVHNNYYTCYFNNDPSQMLRQSVDDKYCINFSVEPYDRKIKSFKEETLLTCELIYDRFKPITEKLNLLFSGGMDSECFLKCICELKIPVNPIIIVHKHIPNSPETINAKLVCEKLNLSPTIYHLDLHKIYKSNKFHELGLKYQTARLGQTELLYVIESIAEPIISVDDIQMVRQSSSQNLLRKNETDYTEWFYTIREDQDGLYDRFYRVTGIPVIQDPFKYTPQNWAAMITTHHIKELVKNHQGKASSATTKNKMMSKEFSTPNRIKTNVFEFGIHRGITNKLQRELNYTLFPPQIIKLEYFSLLNKLGVKYAL